VGSVEVAAPRPPEEMSVEECLRETVCSPLADAVGEKCSLEFDAGAESNTGEGGGEVESSPDDLRARREEFDHNSVIVCRFKIAFSWFLIKIQ